MGSAGLVKSPLVAETGVGRSTFLHRAENFVCVCVLLLMSVLPIVQVVGREVFNVSVLGSAVVVQHMTMWISFLGAALAARSDRLLALSTTELLPDKLRQGAGVAVNFVAIAITLVLCLASIQLVQTDYEFGDVAGWGVPIWVFTAIMPIAFALITLRLITHSGDALRPQLIAALGCLTLPVLFLLSDSVSGGLLMLLGAVIAIGTVFGMPIYAALGGLALLLFWGEGTPISAVPGEAYRMSTSPMLPAIPLFTLAGYILAAGGSSARLLRLFTSIIGWMPGGIAIVVTLLLAFFTPLTGASGVTILAMGGLLLPLLVKSGYSEKHSIGLVTVSGSIGVFLPPSLPVILYAYYAELDLDEMFIAGIVPGLLLILVIAGWGAWGERGAKKPRQRFVFQELRAALWSAKWEALLPVVMLGSIFGGFATLVEASALTVLYAVLVECVFYRELRWRTDLLRVVVESATMIGGFMIILSVALGLTNYLIIAQIPMQVLSWVSAYIESPYVFLLALNVFLIIVGALMDIYSAIIVIVPLIAPMAAAYGINPVHLGIVFLANMQLGYLVPPMGENLFLSAYRFDRPLAAIYHSVLPFVAVILVVVLFITYMPGLMLWLLAVLGGSA